MGQSSTNPVETQSDQSAHPSQSIIRPLSGIVRPLAVESSAGPRPITPQCYRDNSATGYLHRDGDYVSITGIAEHLYVRNVWRIRYATCDGEDPFDGNFTFPDSALNSELHPGRLACIQGQIAENKEGRRFVLLDVHEVDNP
jgi:hypothetical protein